MHITMLAVGSRGDVQPFVALGRGLAARGYQVRVATHAIFESFVRGEGLEFARLEGNPNAIVQSDEGRAWLESNRNPLTFASGFRKLMGPVLRQAMADAYEAAQGTDAIIVTGPSYYFGVSVATKLNVPFIQAYAQPLHPTGAFSSSLVPLKNMGNPVLNYATHVIGGQMFLQLLRPTLNEARRDFLQLPPLPLMGDFLELTRRKLPVLYAYSEAVLPKPKNWGDFLHVTGYWFLDQPGWQPPAALQAFLDAGSPPVYIGFGSMSDRNPERMTEIALKALEASGQRGILMTGWGGLTQADLPNHVFKLEAAPHDWLFPRMAAVVHHGGAGTTAAGLRAGRPSIVIPFFGDQTFWGVRVTALGVGAMLERKTLTAEQLAAAIRQAVTDNEMRARAAALGERIRAEDGIGAAIAVIDRYLERKPTQVAS